MKTLLLTLTYTVGIGEFVLAVYFWVTNSKSEVRRVMALLTFSTALWVFTTGLSSYTHEGPLVTIILKFVYVFGAIMITSLVHLSIVYPLPLIRIDYLHRILLYLPAAMLVALVLFSNLIVQGLKVNPSIPGLVLHGPAYDFYNIVLLIFFATTLFLLSRSVARSDGANKKSVLMVLLSIVVGGSIPVSLDLIIPTFFPSADVTNFLIAPIATIIWLGGTTLIINRR